MLGLWLRTSGAVPRLGQPAVEDRRHGLEGGVVHGVGVREPGGHRRQLREVGEALGVDLPVRARAGRRPGTRRRRPPRPAGGAPPTRAGPRHRCPAQPASSTAAASSAASQENHRPLIGYLEHLHRVAALAQSILRNHDGVALRRFALQVEASPNGLDSAIHGDREVALALRLPSRVSGPRSGTARRRWSAARARTSARARSSPRVRAALRAAATSCPMSSRFGPRLV